MTATPARELDLEPYTRADLADAVHDRMAANGGDRAKAIREFVRTLADQMRGEARTWWLSVGFEMVRHVVGMAERGGVRYATGGVPPSEQNESRFSGGMDLLNVYMPYSTSDPAKPVGEFTPDNWRSYEAMRRKQANTMLADADRAAVLADRMPEDATLRDVWDDLPEDVQGWVEDKVRGR